MLGSSRPGHAIIQQQEADMKRTALTFSALAAMALLSGCATDGYDSAYYSGGGGGYYGGGGSYYGGYYDGYYGPDYYPGGIYGYAYIPRGGYGGGYRDYNRGYRDRYRGNGQTYNGGQGYRNGGDRQGSNGNWNRGDRGNWRNNQSAGAAQSGNVNPGGDRITRGNFWRQNQSMSQPQQAAPSGPALTGSQPSGDFRGRGRR